MLCKAAYALPYTYHIDTHHPWLRVAGAGGDTPGKSHHHSNIWGLLQPFQRANSR